jgi:hypothetical protein
VLSKGWIATLGWWAEEVEAGGGWKRSHGEGEHARGGWRGWAGRLGRRRGRPWAPEPGRMESLACPKALGRRARGAARYRGRRAPGSGRQRRSGRAAARPPGAPATDCSPRKAVRHQNEPVAGPHAAPRALLLGRRRAPRDRCPAPRRREGLPPASIAFLRSITRLGGRGTSAPTPGVPAELAPLAWARSPARAQGERRPVCPKFCTHIDRLLWRDQARQTRCRRPCAGRDSTTRSRR